MAKTTAETQAADLIESSAINPTNGLGVAQTGSAQDDDPERLRGVVVLPHDRRVLFSDDVELDAAKLPRWQPHVNVDERRLSDQTHE